MYMNHWVWTAHDMLQYMYTVLLLGHNKCTNLVVIITCMYMYMIRYGLSNNNMLYPAWWWKWWSTWAQNWNCRNGKVYLCQYWHTYLSTPPGTMLKVPDLQVREGWGLNNNNMLIEYYYTCVYYALTVLSIQWLCWLSGSLLCMGQQYEWWSLCEIHTLWHWWWDICRWLRVC